MTISRGGAAGFPPDGVAYGRFGIFAQNFAVDQAFLGMGTESNRFHAAKYGSRLEPHCVTRVTQWGIKIFSPRRLSVRWFGLCSTIGKIPIR